ncbi:MAG: ATP phosphoribosyltransferase regulatory subunit [Aestuariivirga sp.]
MAGRSATQRAALEKQNAAIMAVFERAGFEQIAPDIIQPADIFLERSGEDIRARTFVFNDPNGNELCLRPDLTVPACRYHLSHAAKPEVQARYCYLGPAFRFPDERLSPQEFTQAGLEWFGAGESVAAEARVLKLAISALEAAGASALKVTLGDIGLFSALLDDIEMPARWRRRLRHQFWRPKAFHALLETFTQGGAQNRSSISAVVDQVKGNGLATVQDVLAAANIVPVGLRSIEDIAERLAEKSADRSENPLAVTQRLAIETLLAITGTCDVVLKKLRAVSGGKTYQAAVGAFAKRLEALEEQGLNPRRFDFSASFGRELEYYTGLVFQIEAESSDGKVAVAGGGRYDDLLSDLGAPQKISAVGCAIHTERLAMVLK